MPGSCFRCGAVLPAVPAASGSVTCPTCGAGDQATAPAPQPDARALVHEMRDLKRLLGEVLQFQAQILAVITSWPQPSTPPAAETTAAPLPSPLPRVRQRRKTVLVVDDDPVAREEARRALESADVPVRAVADGPAALEALKADTPDVLVVEAALGPPLDGRDLTRTIKQSAQWRDVPVILHTRAAVRSMDEARTEYAAQDVVMKAPGSADALVTRVIRIFQSARD